MSRFYWLIRREIWEHKAIWVAPVVVLGCIILLMIIGQVHIDPFNGAEGGVAMGRMPHEKQIALLTFAYALLGVAVFLVMGVIAFFYSLDSLYADRRDRSVLFWKSLPISDTQTVLSKVASAVLVAPLLAVLASVITMYCFMAVISVVVMLHGGNAWTLIWGPASPLWVIGGHVAWIPVYALWALPTVGWLLLCSAWARSKPFLWAIMVPLFAGIFVSWFDIMKLFDLDGSWFWAHVVARMLLGTVPLADFFYRGDMGSIEGNESLQGVLSDLSPANHLASLTMPELWIGVIAGAVMIFAAIRLRRWRDEG
jgi:ABC-2 type transport system permease protein